MSPYQPPIPVLSFCAPPRLCSLQQVAEFPSSPFVYATVFRSKTYIGSTLTPLRRLA